MKIKRWEAIAYDSTCRISWDGEESNGDAIMAQVDDIAMEIEQTSKQIEELEAMLKKRSCSTPPDAPDD